MTRRLEDTNPTLEFVDAPECTCPVWGTEFGPPSIRDFEMRYFQIIQDLRFKELLTAIDASGMIQEVDPNPTPSGTPAPSAPPVTVPATPSPTAAPVDTSAAPTDSPVDEASAAPTDSPVEDVSSAPTGAPTVSPTRPITPSPSQPEA